MMDEQSSPPPLHVWVGTAVVAALILAAGWAGYGLGQELAWAKYVDVPERIVTEPYEVRVEVPVDRPVPGPTVYVPVPGPMIMKKIFVGVPQHCPAPPSVADALNEYEALSLRQCRLP